MGAALVAPAGRLVGASRVEVRSGGGGVDPAEGGSVAAVSVLLLATVAFVTACPCKREQTF